METIDFTQCIHNRIHVRIQIWHLLSDKQENKQDNKAWEAMRGLTWDGDGTGHVAGRGLGPSGAGGEEDEGDGEELERGRGTREEVGEEAEKVTGKYGFRKGFRFQKCEGNSFGVKKL